MGWVEDEMGQDIVEYINLGELKEFAASLGPQTLRNYDHFTTNDLYQWFCVRDEYIPLAYGFLRGLVNPNKKHICVLGMVVHDSFQGQGIGTKLGKYMIEWAHQKYSKIALGVYFDNPKALKFYVSLGFAIEGVLHREEIKNGEYRDLITMGMYL